jgi:hypothetical protein
VLEAGEVAPADPARGGRPIVMGRGAAALNGSGSSRKAAAAAAAAALAGAGAPWRWRSGGTLRCTPASRRSRWWCTTDEPRRLLLRVRVEIMGPGKCRIVGKSQSVLMRINDPIISTRTVIQCLRTLMESELDGIRANWLTFGLVKMPRQYCFSPLCFASASQYCKRLFVGVLAGGEGAAQATRY